MIIHSPIGGVWDDTEINCGGFYDCITPSPWFLYRFLQPIAIIRELATVSDRVGAKIFALPYNVTGVIREIDMVGAVHYYMGDSVLALYRLVSCFKVYRLCDT